MNTKLRNSLVASLVVVVAVGVVWMVKSRAQQRASQAVIDHNVGRVARFVKNPTQLRQVVTTQQHLRDGQTVSEDEVTTLIGVVNGPPDNILQAKAITALMSAQDQKQLSGAQEEKAIDAAIAKLQSPERLMRVSACSLLGHCGARRAIPQIMPLLRDSDHTVQVVARRALTRLGSTG